MVGFDMEDLFSVSGGRVMSVDDLVSEIYRLYLENLYSILLAGNLGVDELVKLGRVVVPLGDRVVGGGGGVVGGERDILRVIAGGG